MIETQQNPSNEAYRNFQVASAIFSYLFGILNLLCFRVKEERIRMTEDDPTFDLTKKKKKKKKTAFDPEADGEKQEVIVIDLQKILVYLLCIYQL